MSMERILRSSSLGVVSGQWTVSGHDDVFPGVVKGLVVDGRPNLVDS
ncbi:hypothetical protein [Streptomyces sp. NPDC059278]